MLSNITSLIKLRSDRLSFALLLLLLLSLPIYRGGNVPVAVAALMMASSAMFIFSVMGATFAKITEQSIAWFALWLVTTITVILHITWVPALANLGIAPSDGVADLIGRTDQAVSIFRSLSVWAYFCSMLIIAWRASWLTREQIRGVLFAILLMSLFQACFALYQLLSGTTSILGMWEKVYGIGDATGTYINRNHFSGLLSICWPPVLAFLLIRGDRLIPSTFRSSRVVIAVFYSVIVAIALVTSHSRMGLLATVFGLIVGAVLFSRAQYASIGKALPKWISWLIVSFVVVMALWFGVSDIVERFTTLENGDSRIGAWQAMFDLPLNAWLFGIGPGAFEDVFHLVQPTHLRVKFVHAHNDYLEFVLEFGAIFSILIIASLFYFVKSSYPTGISPLRAGLFGSVAAMVLHSLVDFNLQIPANGLYFSVMLGLILNANIVQPKQVITDNVVEKPAARARSANRKTRQRSKTSNKQSFWDSLIHPKG